MVETNPLTIIFLTEAVAVVAVLLVAALFIYWRRRRRDEVAVDEFVDKVVSNEEQRNTTLNDFFNNECQCSAEEAETVVKALLKKERLFYKHMVDVYYNRDGDAFVNLDERLNDVTNIYRDILSKSASAIHAQSEVQAKLQEEESTAQLLSLSTENKALHEAMRKLTDEMEENQKVLDDVLTEYASAFSGGREGAKSSGLLDKLVKAKKG
ncbi:MAG: hypothetical protein GXP10_04565 [Gammaproteobacteria bacterium]|nr:hypothetical protein [Gammaproteobacteria bacterium]